MGSTGRAKIRGTTYVVNADDGDLIEIQESVVSFDFDRGSFSGFYVPFLSQVLVLDRMDIDGRMYVRVLTERGATWLHPSTQIKVI